MSPVCGCQQSVRPERLLSEGSGARTAGLIPDWLKSSASLTLHLAAAIPQSSRRGMDELLTAPVVPPITSTADEYERDGHSIVAAKTPGPRPSDDGRPVVLTPPRPEALRVGDRRFRPQDVDLAPI